MTPIRNFLWIDGTMTLPQSRARRGFVLAGVLVRAVTALGPVNRDPSEERLVAGETVSSRSDAEQK